MDLTLEVGLRLHTGGRVAGRGFQVRLRGSYWEMVLGPWAGGCVATGGFRWDDGFHLGDWLGTLGRWVCGRQKVLGKMMGLYWEVGFVLWAGLWEAWWGFDLRWWLSLWMWVWVGRARMEISWFLLDRRFLGELVFFTLAVGFGRWMDLERGCLLIYLISLHISRKWWLFSRGCGYFGILKRWKQTAIIIAEEKGIVKE